MGRSPHYQTLGALTLHIHRQWANGTSADTRWGRSAAIMMPDGDDELSLAEESLLDEVVAEPFVYNRRLVGSDLGGDLRVTRVPRWGRPAHTARLSSWRQIAAPVPCACPEYVPFRALLPDRIHRSGAEWRKASRCQVRSRRSGPVSRVFDSIPFLPPVWSPVLLKRRSGRCENHSVRPPGPPWAYALFLRRPGERTPLEPFIEWPQPAGGLKDGRDLSGVHSLLIIVSSCPLGFSNLPMNSAGWLL